MKTITPKNWGSFQHYKDRSPSWIKLHRNILDDYEFSCLPVASRALAPLLWLLASECIDGSIELNLKKLSFRLRISEKEFEQSVKPLIDSGFFIMAQDASELLAEGLHDSSPHALARVREYKQENINTEEKEILSGKPDAGYSNDFENFWSCYPKRPNSNKSKAFKAWGARIKSHATDLIIAGAKRYAAYCLAEGTEPRFIKHAESFLGPDLHFLTEWASSPSRATAQKFDPVAFVNDKTQGGGENGRVIDAERLAR